MIQIAFSSLAFFEWERLQHPEIEDPEIVLEHGIAYLKKYLITFYTKKYLLFLFRILIRLDKIRILISLKMLRDGWFHGIFNKNDCKINYYK